MPLTGTTELSDYKVYDKLMKQLVSLKTYFQKGIFATIISPYQIAWVEELYVTDLLFPFERTWWPPTEINET